jgi:hypothetical protein
MTAPIHLTATEIADISGYQKRSCQIAWLRENGFTVKIRADGTPLVARANYLKVMGAAPDATPRQSAKEPDFSIFQDAS